jgi:hypothetical protein
LFGPDGTTGIAGSIFSANFNRSDASVFGTFNTAIVKGCAAVDDSMASEAMNNYIRAFRYALMLEIALQAGMHALDKQIAQMPAADREKAKEKAMIDLFGADGISGIVGKVRAANVPIQMMGELSRSRIRIHSGPVIAYMNAFETNFLGNLNEAGSPLAKLLQKVQPYR